MWAASVELVKCTQAPILLQADANDLRPHLPPGFEPIGFVADGLADVKLEVTRCQGAVANHLTVLGPVAFAVTLVHVRVNQTLEEGSTSQWFLFEFFSDSPFLVSLFSAGGMPARIAQIGLEFEAPQSHASITVEGDAWYEGVGTYRTHDQPTFHDDFRWFHVPSGSTVVWANVNQTSDLNSLADPLALTVNDGFLRNIQPAQNAPAEALTQEIQVAGQISFGRL